MTTLTLSLPIQTGTYTDPRLWGILNVQNILTTGVYDLIPAIFRGNKVNSDHAYAAVYHLSVATGIPWATVLQWMLTYGLPVVIQFLSIVLPLILAGKMTVAQAEQYAIAYFAAIIAGQTPPPPPV